MHEWSLVRALVREVCAEAGRRGGGKVLAVRVRIGPLASLAPELLREQFALAAIGGPAEGALMDVEVCNQSDPDAAHAVILEGFDLEG